MPPTTTTLVKPAARAASRSFTAAAARSGTSDHLASAASRRNLTLKRPTFSDGGGGGVAHGSPSPRQPSCRHVCSSIHTIAAGDSDSLLPAAAGNNEIVNPFMSRSKPAFEATEKDMESEEALRALYERWLRRFDMTRQPEEMAGCFEAFKETVMLVHEENRSRPGSWQINKFADGWLAARTPRTSRGELMRRSAKELGRGIKTREEGLFDPHRLDKFHEFFWGRMRLNRAEANDSAPFSLRPKILDIDAFYLA